MKVRRSVALSFAALAVPALFVAGCHSHTLPTPATEQARAEQRAMAQAERDQIGQIPPPSKNRFMAIRSFDSWQNPYLTIQPEMLTVHILMADANPSASGAGGMLRPVGARRQEVSITLDKLAEAMTSIPQSAWPYGRVVAIEEAHKTPAAQEPAVRRATEQAIGTLNDLGVVVYDLNEGTVR